MTKFNHEYYSSSASRGFSYRIPHVAHDILKKLLKKLPTAARPIYRGYYDDVMASRACAQDSANAMIPFIQGSFPKISKDHNRLAMIMNAEIDKDWHSYVPVKMPIAADVMGAVSDDEADIMVQVSRARKLKDGGTGSHTLKPRRTTTPGSNAHEMSLFSLSPPESMANAQASQGAEPESNPSHLDTPDP